MNFFSKVLMCGEKIFFRFFLFLTSHLLKIEKFSNNFFATLFNVVKKSFLPMSFQAQKSYHVEQRSLLGLHRFCSWSLLLFTLTPPPPGSISTNSFLSKLIYLRRWFIEGVVNRTPSWNPPKKSVSPPRCTLTKQSKKSN